MVKIFDKSPHNAAIKEKRTLESFKFKVTDQESEFKGRTLSFDLVGDNYLCNELDAILMDQKNELPIIVETAMRGEKEFDNCSLRLNDVEISSIELLDYELSNEDV